MKALTLLQPWATLVAIGAKRIETRSWSTPYRGDLLITASGRVAPSYYRLVQEPPFARALATFAKRDGDRVTRAGLALPLGCVVAIVRLVDIVPTAHLVADSEAMFGFADISDAEAAFGDYSSGRFAWLLDNLRPLEPRPCKGRRRLWHPNDLILSQLRPHAAPVSLTR